MIILHAATLQSSLSVRIVRALVSSVARKVAHHGNLIVLDGSAIRYHVGQVAAMAFAGAMRRRLGAAMTATYLMAMVAMRLATQNRDGYADKKAGHARQCAATGWWPIPTKSVTMGTSKLLMAATRLAGASSDGASCRQLCCASIPGS